MLTYILFGVVGLVALLLVLIALRPADYRIERAATTAAPPGAVLDLIEDFHQWKRWSPWDRMDPTQVVTVGGPPRGVGATYHWVGKKNGEGRMEIVDHVPGERVGIRLDFVKPFPSTSRCDFLVAPGAGGAPGSRVIWRMSGSNNFMGKAFDFFANMDRMLGRDFERGLEALGREAALTTGTGGGASGVATSGDRTTA